MQPGANAKALAFSMWGVLLLGAVVMVVTTVFPSGGATITTTAFPSGGGQIGAVERLSGGWDPISTYSIKGPDPARLAAVREEELVPDKASMRLHDAHVKGRVHKGVWIFVVDSDGLVLTIKRHKDLKTCPSTWGLLGEHLKPGEGVGDSVLRAVREELGGEMGGHVRVSRNLTEHWLWYYHQYRDGRKDRQATWPWLVVLDGPHRSLPVETDEEADGVKWVTPGELFRWARERPGDFCHESLTSLMSKCEAMMVGELAKVMPPPKG